MATTVIIKSPHDGTCLEFSDYSGGYYNVTLNGPGFHGSGSVYADATLDLVAFFRDLAEHWRGWNRAKRWESLDGELALEATSDTTGHANLAVRLRSGAGPFEWTLMAMILIEAGQLDAVAAMMDKFLTRSSANER